jgi:hypothetical protein
MRTGLAGICRWSVVENLELELDARRMFPAIGPLSPIGSPPLSNFCNCRVVKHANAMQLRAGD